LLLIQTDLLVVQRFLGRPNAVRLPVLQAECQRWVDETEQVCLLLCTLPLRLWPASIYWKRSFVFMT
jgi:hypothetical protein